MKTLVTTTGSYLTGDDISDAVIEYWEVLADNHASAVVEIPFYADDDRISNVRLTIGWMLPLAVVDSTSPLALEDTALVQLLHLRARPDRSYADTPFSAGEVSVDADWS